MTEVKSYLKPDEYRNSMLRIVCRAKGQRQGGNGEFGDVDG